MVSGNPALPLLGFVEVQKGCTILEVQQINHRLICGSLYGIHRMAKLNTVEACFSRKKNRSLFLSKAALYSLCSLVFLFRGLTIARTDE
jgi:hypothetical protein